MVLQKQLNQMPLIPLNGQLRKKRDKLETKLLEVAKLHNDVSAINLMAGIP